jgi:hypothetical protein
MTSFAFLTIPRTDDLTMTSGKKAETKVATLKGQEGNQVLRKLSYSRLNNLDQPRTRSCST